MPQAIPFIMAAGAAMSAVSAIKQGKAAKAAAEFNANMARQNAGLAREQAAKQTAQHDREQFMRIGAIRAAQGKSGGAAEGSVHDILADTAAQGELQRQEITYQGELKARGFENTATLDEMQGKNASKQGVLKAGSELLSGGADAYGAFGKLKRGG
jgi:hypothetical protein